jgi:protein dithiol:quinone oxidoreductase
MTARAANTLGFLACAALLGYAYYAQYVMHLEPCPLCIFQRVGIFVVGIAFALAAGLDPVSWGRKLYAAAIALAALATVGIAARHLYIQSLPPDSVPACGASLEWMLKVSPLPEVIVKVLSGSGECAKINWRLFGLSMPGWVAIAAVLLALWGLWANLRRRPPVLRF